MNVGECCFISKTGTNIKDLFQHAEFEDWDFQLAKENLRTPVHKSAVRKLLQACKGGAKAQQANEEEDGEIDSSEREEQLKLFSDTLAKCAGRAKAKEIHVETTKILKQECGNWGGIPYFMLPCSEGTNLMAAEIDKLKRKGIEKPFVNISLAKFLPEWHGEKYQDAYLLPPQVLMPTLMRWAMAAQANGMIPLPVGATHADICMRAAAEAKSKGKYATVAAAYDEIKQKQLSDMCLKGVSDFDPSAMLIQFDRETFEQACQLAESRMASNCRHGTADQWKSKSWSKGSGKGSWSQDKSWQHQGQKRSYDQVGKHWDASTKKRKY